MRRERFTLFDVPIDNVTMQEALDHIVETVDQGGPCTELHFVNAHCMNVSCEDEEYRKILQESDSIFADGSGIRMAAEMMGSPIADNVNGTDMFPLLCSRFEQEGKRIFLLGAAPGIAERAAAWVGENYGESVVTGSRDGFFTVDQHEEIFEEIAASQADLLLVAMGVPRQEKWIRSVRHSLPVSCAMGVGGLFDFYSGNISRAPGWMRSIGIEWLWRLMMEPRRMWRRYIIGNYVFIRRVKKERRKN